MQGVVGQFLGCAVFAYFAVVSLVNARLGIANRDETLAGLEGPKLKEAVLFLRIWLAINVLACILLGFAAILIWRDWQAAVILACVPVLIFAIANITTGRQAPGEGDVNGP